MKTRDRYQTVYAKRKWLCRCSTAGLHFTPELLQRLKLKRRKMVSPSLDWEPSDLFLSIMSTNMRCTQNFTPQPRLCRYLNSVKAAGGRIITVGTTSIEHWKPSAINDGQLQSRLRMDRIFIKPGFQFTVVMPSQPTSTFQNQPW